METSPIPYGRQTITESDISAVVDVLRSPLLTQGPSVPAFESALADVFSARHVVAVNSATSALHLGCLALGLGPGDRLWTSPITFVASANCGRYCGAQIDFIDIDPSTGLMCLEALRRKLKISEDNGTLPKVIVPVHLTGSSCAMDEIEALVRPYGIKILEDASHAVGAKFRDRPVGSCAHSDISVFSFHPVKIITTAEGGAASTNNTNLADHMALLRSHGITKDVNRFQLNPSGPWSYEQQSLGFNYRLTDLQAALGLSQLQRLTEIVSERNRLFENYSKLLEPLPVQLLKIPLQCYSSVHLAVIRLAEDKVSLHRFVFEGLRNAGIGVQLHYSPVHLQPDYQRLGFNEGDFPNAEAYASSAFSLPLFPGLLEEEQLRVVETLSSLLHHA